jgi:acyl-homoserine-lactone acylase
VTGVSLLGHPLIAIGHTRGMAWTHTVNFSFRFALYELGLVPGQPTSYLYDGHAEAMRPQTVTVQARDAGGSLQPRSHTFWLTRYGPMVDVQPPAIAWNPVKGYAMRDINANYLRLMDQFLAIDRAQSVAELRRALVRWQGIPWVNTIAADSGGHAYYADLSVTPHITDQQIHDCVTPGVGTAALQAARLPVLDGSKPSCALGSDPDAVQSGIFGPSHLPQLERRDYVRNSNDPPWLANPHQPLTGYPFVVNDTTHDIGLRPRLSIKMVEGRLHGTDGEGPPGFTLGLMQRAALGDRNYSAELARDAVVSMCERNPVLIASDGGAVQTGPACGALRAWNLRADLDSRGEGLWKEFWLRVLGLSTPVWTTPFDAADPVDTPSGFAADSPDVKRAFADAVEYLQQHAIAPDATTGSLQHPGDVPLHGCDAQEGCFDDIGLSNSPTAPVSYHLADYAHPDFGTSSLQATTWTGRDAQPVAATILTYSQSTNPASPFSNDQAELFSSKTWLTSGG